MGKISSIQREIMLMFAHLDKIMMSAIEPLEHWSENFSTPLIIAGPCSAESEDLVMQTAYFLDSLPQVQIFRAGIWKPRSRPGGFSGVGDAGLRWLTRVKEETSLLTATEVMSPKHVELAIKAGIDVLWIGARTAASPYAVQEIADALKGAPFPILIKNPVSEDLPLWLGAIERILLSGVKKIAAVHRGFSRWKPGIFRNPPQWDIPLALKKYFPDLPLLNDPSHIAGSLKLIPKVCRTALDLNFQGLMIETHICPQNALTDSKQQLTPEELKKLLDILSYDSSSKEIEALAFS